MAHRTVRYDDHRGELVVGSGPDERTVHNTGADQFHAHIDDIAQAGATSLRNALRHAPGVPVHINAGPYEHFDYEHSPPGPVSIGLDGAGCLVVDVSYEIDDWYEPSEVFDRAERILAPLLKRTRCDFTGADVDDMSAAAPWFGSATLLPSTHGRSVAEVYRIGVEAEALLSAASSGELTRATTLDLLRAGHTEALLGQPESLWLDAKRQDYDLSKGQDRGRISLAQDVARFANGEEGGVIVIGFATRRHPGGETISKLTPVRAPDSGTTRHAKAIDNRVFPAVDGLTVEEIPVDGGVIIVINVPPQPEELKPFLVHGAIVNGKVEGAYISILRRRGEDSIPITAQAIHSTLAAGRALLRRGVVVPSSDDD